MQRFPNKPFRSSYLDIDGSVKKRWIKILIPAALIAVIFLIKMCRW